MTGKFPKLMTDTKPRIQEAERKPSRIHKTNKPKTKQNPKTYMDELLYSNCHKPKKKRKSPWMKPVGITPYLFKNKDN